MITPKGHLGKLLIKLINEPLLDTMIIDIPHGKIYFVPIKSSYIDRIKNMVDIGNKDLMMYEQMDGFIPGIKFRKMRHYARYFSKKRKPYRVPILHSKIDKETRIKLDTIRILSRKPLFYDDDLKADVSLHQVKRQVADANSNMRRLFMNWDQLAGKVNARNIPTKTSSVVEDFLESLF